MHLTRLLCGVVLIASGCTSIWAQTAPLTPNPVVPGLEAPKPFQFNGAQYSLLPGWPVILKPRTPIVIARQILLNNNKPCAAARIMKPNPAIDPRIDPQMIPRHTGPAPMPIEIHSRDITEMNVPAPSCADIAAPQELNAGPEKR